MNIGSVLKKPKTYFGLDPLKKKIKKKKPQEKALVNIKPWAVFF